MRKLNTESDGTADGIRAALDKVAKSVDDGMSDWLAERAESPAGWLYSQI